MAQRVLVVYYSMSGNSRSVAYEIRMVLDAEIEEIREARPRQGLGGVLRALFDAITRREPPIEPVQHDPDDYDLLVLGGPVWAGRMASPIRTYARREGGKARRVAFFCTEGGRGAEQAFDDLQQLCGRSPVATLVVDAAHLTADGHRDGMLGFASQLQPTAPAVMWP